MASKCPGCNKFCSMELQDPEVNNMDFDGDSEEKTINYDVRIVRTSECCGEDIKEACFDGTITFEVEGHEGEDHVLEMSEDLEQYEEGGGRYTKSYFGFQAFCHITCSCGNPVIVKNVTGDADVVESKDNIVEFTCKIAASGMDEVN